MPQGSNSPLPFSGDDCERLIGYTIILLLPLYVLGSIAYNLRLHPLSDVPGPLLGRCSRIWYVQRLLRGTLAFDIRTLHDRFGPVVRIAPDELSFNSPQAWRDIYGARKGAPEIPKDPLFYGSLTKAELSLLFAPKERHGYLRGLLSHGFSVAAMRAQEPMLQKFSDLFIKGLATTGKVDTGLVDVGQWLNYFTFDLTGELAYGESFDCLANAQSHPWIDTIFENQKSSVFFRAASYYPTLAMLLQFFIPRSLVQQREAHHAFTVEKARRRMAKQDLKGDIVERMVGPESGINEEEFVSNTSTIMIGGSETTSTVSAGLFFYVLHDPKVKRRLVDEVRTTFQSQQDVTIAKLGELKYMSACINEALRMYPPFPANFPRRTVKAEVIDGYSVPAQITVSVFQWSTHHSPANFSNPDRFNPDRWLDSDDPAFAKDKRDSCQPFHLGPRNCIGQSLAKQEIRLLLAKAFLEFDIELGPGQQDWDVQKVFMSWQRGPLWIKAIPAVTQA